MNSTWKTIITSVALLLQMSAIAQIVIPEVPSGLSNERKEDLYKIESALNNKKAVLEQKVKAFNAKCTEKDIPESNKQLIAECTTDQAAIESDKASLRADIGVYLKNIESSKGAMAADLEKEIAELHRKIESDKTAIRNLGFDKRQEQFEEWEKLSAEKKKEFEAQTLKALKTSATSLFEIGLKSAATTGGKNAIEFLDHNSAAEVRRKLEQMGIADPYFLELVDKVAKAKNKEEKLKVGIDFAENLKNKIKGGVGIEENIKNGRTDDAAWDAALFLMNTMFPDPRLKAISTLGTEEARVMLYEIQWGSTELVAANQVRKLTSLTEEQLKILVPLTDLMEKHVRELNQAKDDLKMLKANIN